MRALRGCFQFLSYFFLTVALTQHTCQADEYRLSWRMENPFRLFYDPKDTEKFISAFRRAKELNPGSPILATERLLQQESDRDGWAASLFWKTCYGQESDSFRHYNKKDRWRRKHCSDYVHPKAHNLLFELKGDNIDGTCQWIVQKAATNEPLVKNTGACREMTIRVPYKPGRKYRVRVAREGSVIAQTPDDTPIEIRDLLIIGLGDSFASGEGNPDLPVKFDPKLQMDYGRLKLRWNGEIVDLSGYPTRYSKTGDPTDLHTDAFYEARAKWWDRECHRSLYSHQLRVALQIAIENPQQAVTFISFACSGAEVTQGILAPKPIRECQPGEDKRYSWRENEDIFIGQLPGQLTALSRDICRSDIKTSKIRSAIISRLKVGAGNTTSKDKFLWKHAQKLINSSIAHCPKSKKRKADLVLLSIGGNDMGFSPVVAHAILHDKAPFRNFGRDTVHDAAVAEKRITYINARYSALASALKSYVGVKGNAYGGQNNVVITAYPPIAYDEQGTLCSKSKSFDVFPPFKVSEQRLKEAEHASDKLFTQMGQLAKKYGWKLVSSHRSLFRKHGLCAENDAASVRTKYIRVPRYQEAKGWRPYSPVDYLPYKSRQRWIRTPADSFLTAHYHSERGLLAQDRCSKRAKNLLETLEGFNGKVNYWKPLQLFFASIYGGAFHPNAEGQAVMADAVMKDLRKDPTLSRELGLE